MPVEVSLCHLLNLNHSVLSGEQRDELIESVAPDMFEAIEVPTSIAMSAEDMLIIEAENPRAWELLLENENIKVLPAYFSQSLNELFPKVVSEQASIASDISSILLPEEKRLAIGHTPELSLLPVDEEEAVGAHWAGSIFCDYRASSRDGLDLPSVFQTELGFTYLKSERNGAFRVAVHSFLREEIDADELLAALYSDASNNDGTVPAIVRIDFETPLLNAVQLPGRERSLPRVDLFRDFHAKLLQQNAIAFTFVGEGVAETAHILPILESPVPSEHATHKWRPIEGLGDFVSTDRQYASLLRLSCLTADYFLKPEFFTPEKHQSFPAWYEGELGTVSIVRSIQRQAEFSAKIQALETGVELNGLDAAQQLPFLKLTHRALQRAATLLCLN